jgi:acyl carrier protein phosphodiesterase
MTKAKTSTYAKITYFYGMNFLSHIYLSGENNLIKIGNLVADGIHGKSYQNYPQEMQIGILLHREIDTFTDAHELFRRCTKRLHHKYSHYSGIVVDIYFDHFLAKNWSSYHDVPLNIYVNNFYEMIQKHEAILPEKFKRLLPFMIAQNWLVSYANFDGLQEVFNGMHRRTRQKAGLNEAITELKLYYDAFETDFTVFFEDLRVFSQIKLNHLISTYQLKSNFDL